MPGIGASIISLLFSGKDHAFDPHKYGAIEIGGYKLPLQSMVSINIPKIMEVTRIAGASRDPDLSGATVKEMMGIGEATIIIEGVIMTNAGTFMENLKAMGAEGVPIPSEDDWLTKLQEIDYLFEAQESLEIKGVYINEDGEEKNIFEALWIFYVVIEDMRIEDIPGADRKKYHLRLIQDRPFEITKLLPTEKGKE